MGIEVDTSPQDSTEHLKNIQSDHRLLHCDTVFRAEEVTSSWQKRPTSVYHTEVFKAGAWALAIWMSEGQNEDRQNLGVFKIERVENADTDDMKVHGYWWAPVTNRGYMGRLMPEVAKKKAKKG